MNFNEFPADELNRRFVGSIVYSKEMGAPVEIMELSRGSCYVRRKDIQAQEPKRLDFEVDNFDLGVPPLGFVPYRTTAAYLQRTPQRQYRYGFVASAVSVVIPFFNNTAITSLMRPNIPVTLRQIMTDGKFMSSLFNRDIGSRYMSPMEAFKTLMVKCTKVAVPLSSDWCLASHTSRPTPVLYDGRTQTAVGVITNSGREVRIHSSLAFMEEEITETLNYKVMYHE